MNTKHNEHKENTSKTQWAQVNEMKEKNPLN